MKFTELMCKEVICISNGQRLGFVSDARVELPEGKIISIIVPGRSRLFGLLRCRDDYVIPWTCIKRMGPDIVLVDIRPEECCVPRPRLGLHF